MARRQPSGTSGNTIRFCKSIRAVPRQLKRVRDFCPQIQYEIFVDWHKIIHPDDLPAAFSAVENAHLTRTLYVAEYRICRANDGVERWMRSVGQYFFDPATDQPYKLTGVSYDITARKTFEQELKWRVDEQTAELTLKNALAKCRDVVLLNEVKELAGQL